MKSFSFQTLPSTSLKALELLQENVKAPFSIRAKSQTSGRGTSAKKWESPLGGLYLQLVFLEKTTKLVPLNAGLLVAKTLDKLYSLPTILKWPNDITYRGRKIGGILCERHLIKSKPYLSLGLGLNIQKILKSDSYDYKAISLEEILLKKIDLDELSQALIKDFEDYFSLDRNKIFEKDFHNYFMPPQSLWHKKGELKNFSVYDSLSDEGFLNLKRKQESYSLQSVSQDHSWYFLDNNLYPKPVFVFLRHETEKRVYFFTDFRDSKAKSSLKIHENLTKNEFETFFFSETKEAQEIIPLISPKKNDLISSLFESLFKKEKLVFSPFPKDYLGLYERSEKSTPNNDKETFPCQ